LGHKRTHRQTLITRSGLSTFIAVLPAIRWQPLNRGDVVPDSRVVRTGSFGTVELQRGEETLTLGANTQISIADKHAAKPFTTVTEYFGEVEVQAQVQNVQHFAVVTPYLAAVVKGTIFTVKSGRRGATVEVDRGHVAVETPHGQTVTVGVGQSASVGGPKGALSVAGKGDLPTVLGPDPKGKPDKPDPKGKQSDPQGKLENPKGNHDDKPESPGKSQGNDKGGGNPGGGGNGGDHGNAGGHGNSNGNGPGNSGGGGSGGGGGGNDNGGGNGGGGKGKH
jgi:hypothetical protein